MEFKLKRHKLIKHKTPKDVNNMINILRENSPRSIKLTISKNRASVGYCEFEYDYSQEKPISYKGWDNTRMRW